MADVAAELLRMKKQIEETKDKKSRFEGKLSSLMDRLQKEFGCETVEAAGMLQEKLSKEVAEKESQLNAKIAEMREQYGI